MWPFFSKPKTTLDLIKDRDELGVLIDEKIDEECSVLIHQLTRDTGISIAKLAKAVDSHPSYLSAVLNGSRQPTEELYLALCELKTVVESGAVGWI